MAVCISSDASQMAIAGRESAQALGRRVLMAAREGRVSDLRELMSLGAPFASDWVGNSALHCAAQGGHEEACRVLLRAGVSRDARTKVERTPLHLAASEGHDRVAALLLEFGARVDVQDMLGMTPLHWAAERGHRDVCARLLCAGAKQMIDRWGRSPAAIATRDLNDLFAAGAQSPQVSEITIEPELPSPSPTPPPTIVEQEDNTELPETQKGNGDGAEALLRAHGITLIPKDKDNTVLSAINSGRTVHLSDAGKALLREAKAKAPTAQPRCVVVPSSFLTNNDPQWLRSQLLSAHAQLAQAKRKNARLSARLKACKCQNEIIENT